MKKRKPGRPKGSKNKNKVKKSEAEYHEYEKVVKYDITENMGYSITMFMVVLAIMGIIAILSTVIKMFLPNNEPSLHGEIAWVTASIFVVAAFVLILIVNIIHYFVHRKVYWVKKK